MKREVLLAEARKHVWAAWQLSAEELASQAVATLHGLGMLVPEGGTQELEKLAKRVAELETDLAAKGQDTEAAVKGWERCRSSLKDATEEIARLESDLGGATARVAELEAAAQQIVHLHKDSPMGPCPVCIDGDAMVRGDDYTVPYPCPTARLAGAKDCDPPSQRQASHLPAEGGDAR
ncbi:hypothetical protein KBZ00_25770 [Streptomyces sp. RK31]|uniref:hypothetical protein n=1 Tax=Streptomyces sp. RK31 TaxID=2824892 RepID=UPI001B390E51|nr:hypothetical protein [Streptomyces sp. RK31]MBQ0974508.1 hypothetical protein [Streptomyces sp. RK31]